jgi:hypothetical protein
VCRAQLLARIDAAVLATEPFPVEELSAGDLYAHSRPAEAFDRRAVKVIGRCALAHQRARAGLQTESELGPGRAHSL